MSRKLKDLKTRLEGTQDRFDSLLDSLLDELEMPPSKAPPQAEASPEPKPRPPKRRDWTVVIVLAVLVWCIVTAFVVSRVL